MGKPIPDKIRPIKVEFINIISAQVCIKNSKELSNQFRDANIYIKPDKTKAELNEFRRIGKRKNELMITYPTTDVNNPRVVLKKGILYVDGIEVDRYESQQSLF